MQLRAWSIHHPVVGLQCRQCAPLPVAVCHRRGEPRSSALRHVPNSARARYSSSSAETPPAGPGEGPVVDAQGVEVVTPPAAAAAAAEAEVTAALEAAAAATAAAAAAASELGDGEPAEASSPRPASPAAEDMFASQELADELTDRTDLGRRGEAWVLASWVAVALVIIPPLQLKGIVALCGTVSLTAGIVFILYALISLGRNLSPMAAPRKKHSLVRNGMYGYVRHPMYAGVLLGAVGLAALTLSEARMAMTVLLWWILECKVELEERLLVARYPEYAEYKQTVPKFLPFT